MFFALGNVAVLVAGATYVAPAAAVIPPYQGPNIIPTGTGAVAEPELEFFGGSGKLYRRVDIHNADGSLWMGDVSVVSGNISVDYSRDERRTLDLELDDADGLFKSDPQGFWYDKIIKVYRGVTDDSGESQYYQLGEFLIDRIEETNFPSTTSVTGRDNTKRMMMSKFSTATAFAVGMPIENAIIALAVGSGITNYNLGKLEGADEIQTIGLGAATAGTITITFSGQTTASIAFNATASTVQSALEALSNVNVGDILVTGGPFPATMTLTFSGPTYSGTNVSQITATPTGLTGGTVTIATTVEGGSGINLTNQIMWEAGVSRWEAAKSLATAYSQELFFDRLGILTMRPFVDPTTAPVQFIFLTGIDGNLSRFSKSTNDSRIFNHVVVKGGNTNEIPVAGSAENTEPASATRIERLGRRTFPFESKLISTNAQAQTLATAMLATMALESYELSLEALPAPWLEVGNAIEFIDPDPSPFAPTRFLLTSLTLPLGVGELMSAEARRVTIVG